MSDQFVSQPASVDVTKVGSAGIGEPTLNTSALKDAAKAFLNSGAKPASSTGEQPNAPQPQSPVQQIPITESLKPAVTPQAPAVAEEIPEGQKVTATDAQGNKTEIDLMTLPDDAIVRMKVNGEVQTFSAKEAREFGMRGAKFTTEMQRFRAEQAQHQQMLEDAKKLHTLVSNDEALAAYVFQTKPHIVEALAEHMGWTKAQAAEALAKEVQAQQQPAQAPAFQIDNPQELADLGQVNSLVESRSQQLQRQVLEQVQRELGAVNGSVKEQIAKAVRETVQNEIATLRNAHEVATFDGEISKTISSVLDANPALKAVPKIEQLLRYEVFQMQPQTPEELTDAIHQVASGIVEQLDATYKTVRKTQVIDKATMEKTGIEPPAGTAPIMSRPISYTGENGKVDFAKIRAAAKAAIGA